MILLIDTPNLVKREAYNGTGKEPTFYDSDNLFIVYLPNLNYHKNIDQINDQISDVGLEIIKIIQTNPEIGVNGIFEIISKTILYQRKDRLSLFQK